MASVRHAVVFSTASHVSARLIALTSTMLIARLLTPSEIGTFAIASAVVMIMNEFRLLGAGAWIIREREATPHKVRRALGLTILISWGLGFSLFLLAPLIADFYAINEIATIFRILSVGFLLAPYISIPTSILSRNFEFRALFVVNVISSIIGFITTIWLILNGFSYYSMAWGYLANVGSEFLLLFLLRPAVMPWVPSFLRMGEIVRFGVFNSLANLTRRATLSAPDMIIGKMGTTFQVGIFSRGLGFVDFVSQTLITGISPVVLPYLSQIKREGGDIASAYLRASVLMEGMVWPVLAVVSVASLPAIRLFFGDQWDQAAPLASWLAIWAMLRMVHWFSNDLLMANGNETVMVIKEVSVFVLLALAVVIAFPYGLNIVAFAFVAVGAIDLVLTSLVLRSCIGVRFTALFRAWRANFAVTLVCLGVTFAVDELVSFKINPAWRPVLFIAAVLPLIWLISLKIFRHPLLDEITRLLARFR